jgi:hypothetical protein
MTGLNEAQVEEMASKLARKYGVAHTDEEADIRAVAEAFLRLVHDGEEFKKYMKYVGGHEGEWLVDIFLEKLASLESPPLEPSRTVPYGFGYKGGRERGMRSFRLTHEASYGEWDLRIGPFLFIYDTDWNRLSLTIINPQAKASPLKEESKPE